ncbi:hypothetical protein Mal35_03450 [Gimesia maris]|nr:hypothetical protein Mal35_03450 [Gimesia maris]
MCLFYRDWNPVAALITYSDSFLLAPLGPNYIRAYPVFLSWDSYSKHCPAFSGSGYSSTGVGHLFYNVM